MECLEIIKEDGWIMRVNWLYEDTVKLKYQQMWYFFLNHYNKLPWVAPKIVKKPLLPFGVRKWLHVFSAGHHEFLGDTSQTHGGTADYCHKVLYG